MPDAGNRETRGEPASPATWGDAFAALPCEAPTPGGWARVQARLPAATPPRVRRRWPRWLAAAASLGLVVALPLRMPQDTTIDLPPQAAVTAPAPLARSAHATLPVARPPSRLTLASDHVAAATATARSATAASHRDGARRRAKLLPTTRAQHPVRTVAEPAGATRLAATNASAQPIESLYAESAQLEQLLALLRDERVASGTSAAVGSDLDDHVGGIDAALAQPGLHTADRDRLWRERVAAMQRLVGLETTNRLLSARGESFNASLVSID